MSNDYQGRLKLTLQGLEQLRKLDDALASIENRAESAREAIAGIGDQLRQNQGKIAQGLRNLQETREERLGAKASIENTAQRRNRRGQYTKGPSPAARRMARDRLREAIADSANARRELRETTLAERQTAELRMRRSRLRDERLPALEMRRLKVRQAKQQRLQGVRELSSSTNQALRLGSFEAQFDRRLQAFRRGGGGTNAPELIEKVFAITQAYAAQKRVISATGDMSSRVTRQQANELNTLSSALARYNEAQLEANRLARSRVERLSAARQMGDKVRRFEEMASAAYEGGANSPISRRTVQEARQFTNRAASAAEIGDQEAFRLASFRANQRLKQLERQEKLATKAQQRREVKRVRDFNVRQSWMSVSEEAQRLAQAPRALPSSAMLAERVARTPGGSAPTRLDELRKLQERQARQAVASINSATNQAEQAAKRLANTQSALNERTFKDKLRQDKEVASQQARQTKQAAKEELEAFDRQVRYNAEKRRDEQRQLQAAIRRGGPSSPIGGKKFIPDSPAFAKEQERQAQKANKSINSATNQAERAVERLANTQSALDERTFKDKLAQFNQLASKELRQIKAANKAELAAFDMQVRHRAGIRKKQQQQRFFRGTPRSAIGEGLIGGAFPALFGQGVGASAGGLLGGLAGGAIGGSFGFGLSLIGTAAGQQVDTLIKNLSTLAGSLKSPTDAMAALEASGFRVSDSLKFQVQQLQSVGRAYDAQTLTLQEVQRRLGPGSLTELGQLNAAQKQLQEQYGAIAAEVQIRLLPVLQRLVEFVGGAVSTVPVPAAGQSRLQRLDPKRFEQLRTQAIRESSIGPFGNFGNKKTFDARLGELVKQELGRRFAGERGRAPQLSPQEKFAAEMQSTQESRKLADQVQGAYRESFNLQRQAHDLQYDGARLNREAADYVYGKEKQIFDLRQQASERAIGNTRAASLNRIERGDLSAREAFASAAGFEQQVLTNIRETVRVRKEGEADISQSRSRLELAMAKLNRDTEDYRRTNAREIEDIERRKLSYVRSVEDYKMRVADAIRDRFREAADLLKQAMTLPAIGAATGGAATGGAATAGAVGGIGNMLPGTKGGPNINEGVGYGRGRLHAGRDLGLDIGDPIHARRAGIVTQAYPKGFGRVGGAVVIRYDDGMQGVYGHTLPGVSAGQRVLAGQRIATVASDGRNTHLHYELRDQAGRILEPLKFILESLKVPAGSVNAQAKASAQISSIPSPRFSPTPIGPTPSAAPLNAANLAAVAQLKGGEREAQRILEAQIKLRQKGLEIGQIEQILQSSQLPQLQQQGAALLLQLEARQRTLDLSDDAVSVGDAQAEASARVKQIEAERASALAKVRSQYKGDAKLAEQVNKQFDLALGIASREEKQRLENLNLSAVKIQNDRGRSEILQLQEDLAQAKAEAAAIERGELQATNAELFKASTLYGLLSDAQQSRISGLAAETEELRRQNEFNRRINETRQDRRVTGAGLQAGFVGAEARAFEDAMKQPGGNASRATLLAQETRLLENQRLVWQNLEQDLIGTSDAISGALTTGLLDIVAGSRQIEEVGRDMLNTMARGFADSAQQQLSALFQRQLAGPAGGLGRLLGGGAQSIDPAASAASGSLWALNGAAAAAAAALQAIAGQAAFHGAMGGGGESFLSGIGSGLASAFNLSPTFGASAAFPAPPISFGGFLASGGDTEPGKFYITGEKEPEFFFPNSRGTVVPQSDLQKADALRAGSQESQPIDIRYTVTEQRGERYVTEEQLRRSNAALSKRIPAITYTGMRNNRGIREYTGI